MTVKMIAILRKKCYLTSTIIKKNSRREAGGGKGIKRREAGGGKT